MVQLFVALTACGQVLTATSLPDFVPACILLPKDFELAQLHQLDNKCMCTADRRIFPLPACLCPFGLLAQHHPRSPIHFTCFASAPPASLSVPSQSKPQASRQPAGDDGRPFMQAGSAEEAADVRQVSMLIFAHYQQHVWLT